jgi:hypothetical protein
VRIFIPSKGRASIIGNRSSRLFPDATIVVHSNEDATLYRRAKLPNPIVVSDVIGDSVGKARQMRFVMENLVEDGEWVGFADDNFESITAVDNSYYGEETFAEEIAPRLARRIYSRPVGSLRLTEILTELRDKAEETGANYCGFASTANYYFRKTKWQYVGNVIGHFVIMRKTKLQIPLRNQDDRYLTAEHLLQDGRILINRFVFPMSPHFTLGGLGTVEQRVIIRTREVRELLERYNGLFSVKNPKGMPKNQDVRLRLHTLTQIAEWREKLDSIDG